MKEVILLLADIVNRIHDALMQRFGLTMTDKQLHFWVIGIIGIIAFFIVYFLFKLIASMKWSITILSFIYTFTMMVVFVFAIELQQALTGGDMEFADAVVGLWGFIVFFLIYVVIALVILAVIKFMRRNK
ncbi:hypothetical protein ERJ70_15020 [Sediminibacillus dalangtanensis]|uniref:Uncharacterized protein n=1 Tax=Sediminibacillus dalangtanensis TaxID=2729421 RepID=A0ABX7VXL2_9BACI|nr:hypothetical protein [Sediminibacillus dalangtanensis]QTN00496.1 hypothetical protein ERJ70_15020 [Sediminibacillus dalangtanensis]